jgi:hypothetical protein
MDIMGVTVIKVIMDIIDKTDSEVIEVITNFSHAGYNRQHGNYRH